MSMQDYKSYTASEYTNCPHCGHEDFIYGDHEYMDGEPPFYQDELSCPACGTEWLELFIRSKVLITKQGEKATNA